MMDEPSFLNPFSAATSDESVWLMWANDLTAIRNVNELLDILDTCLRRYHPKLEKVSTYIHFFFFCLSTRLLGSCMFLDKFERGESDTKHQNQKGDFTQQA
jgi:hypothetical protein